MDKPRPKRQNENPLFGQGNRSGVRPKIRKLEGSSCQPFAERSYFNNIVAENVTCTSNVQINNDSTTSHSSRAECSTSRQEMTRKNRSVNPNAENSGAASTVKKRNFRTSRKPPDQPSDVTIKDAQQLEDGCRVTVTGKIANLMHEGTAYVHGNDLRLHVFVFADHTGSVRLTVWMNSELDLKAVSPQHQSASETSPQEQLWSHSLGTSSAALTKGETDDMRPWVQPSSRHLPSSSSSSVLHQHALHLAIPPNTINAEQAWQAARNRYPGFTTLS
ncbi:uncharacterized protein LOC114799700 [Denticeps clupeoides]|uniref:uncharacterized protein LOC114799700 n=1 Tax=Denticeps clupeoides TaxID=299321 RepID=UPI0010A4DDC1|nr:uncharacterized protein LOC114799700 [Denticeps clupeoides]